MEHDSISQISERRINHFYHVLSDNILLIIKEPSFIQSINFSYLFLHGVHVKKLHFSIHSILHGMPDSLCVAISC